VNAVRKQTELLMHSCFQIGMYENYLEVAERLHRLSPGEFDKKTFLANSGAEAIEGAVKFARAFTQRDAVLTFQYSFHGRTFYALRMTGRAKPYRTGFGSLGGEVARLPFPYAYRMTGGDAAACSEQVLARLDEIFLTELPAESFAAIVFEPILGEGGVVVPPEGFLHRLVDRCRAAGMIIIADEVQTGIGRTGKFSASESFGIKPDLLVFAKSLGFGLPLSAVVGRAEIIDSLSPGGLGGTLGGNPLACAASIAGLDAMEAEGVMHKTTEIGIRALKKLKFIQQRCPIVGDVRGLGLMLGIELVTDRKSRDPASEQTREVATMCREKGVLLLYGGPFGNVIRLLPPLTMEYDELDKAIDVLGTALNDVRG
jgi:4-aminobutyrate aminotransferase/(S)-3-amino-2-methylpropionate transaminase